MRLERGNNARWKEDRNGYERRGEEWKEVIVWLKQQYHNIKNPLRRNGHDMEILIGGEEWARQVHWINRIQCQHWGAKRGRKKGQKALYKTNKSKRFKKLDYLLMEKNRRDRSIESTSWWCQLLDGDRMPGLKKAYIWQFFFSKIKI